MGHFVIFVIYLHFLFSLTYASVIWKPSFVHFPDIPATYVLATSGGAVTFSVGSIIHYLCMYGGSYFRNQSIQFCDDARAESTATKKKSSERMTQLCVHF
ncbi:hypothetical protein WN943_006817 [Citrus x changshan-huyou]